MPDYVALLSKDPEISRPAIKSFVQKFSQRFDVIEKWEDLWRTAFEHLEEDDAAMQLDLTSMVRILSRDSRHMNDVITEENIRRLLHLAKIDSQHPEESQKSADQPQVVVEALKCLCNLVFNSTVCQGFFENLNGAEGIVRRIQKYKEHATKYDIQYLDMKLLFLITALNKNVRSRVRDEFNGLIHLTEFIDNAVAERLEELPGWFEDREIDLICEVLKVLFNLTPNCDAAEEVEKESELLHLATVLRTILLRAKTTNREKRQDLHSNIVNMVSSLPPKVLVQLTPKLCGGSGDDSTVVFEQHDVTAIATFLEFLRGRLENVPKSGIGSSEQLGPILTVLIKCARADRTQRHYIRSIVLPPITNVMTRPEEGSEVKNILCRLLTTVNTQVRDLVAELLFVCCKENVARMAKHTGYGNSLGMFTNRGLLGEKRVAPSQQYSSDSEDSDTEEYSKHRDSINPVTGCYEPSRPNPFEHMSDEQKEYEALRLVNLIDQLDRQGIMKPARIGADGKPEAVEHVLQLQEGDSFARKSS